MKTRGKTIEMRAARFAISILAGAVIAFVPFLLDWLWPQSACSVASFYLLVPGGIVSGILGLQIDSPFFYCAAFMSAIFYAALIYILLSFAKRYRNPGRYAIITYLTSAVFVSMMRHLYV
jgi:hypothetical protein